MRATVRLPGMLRADANGASTIETILVDGATLADLFGQLADQHPRLERRVRDEQGELRRYVNVFVAGVECRSRDGLATALRDGDEVYLVPSVAGG